MSDIDYWVSVHMCKAITLRQYVELAKTVKEKYEKKAPTHQSYSFPSDIQ